MSVENENAQGLWRKLRLWFSQNRKLWLSVLFAASAMCVGILANLVASWLQPLAIGLEILVGVLITLGTVIFMLILEYRREDKRSDEVERDDG